MRVVYPFWTRGRGLVFVMSPEKWKWKENLSAAEMGVFNCFMKLFFSNIISVNMRFCGKPWPYVADSLRRTFLVLLTGVTALVSGAQTKDSVAVDASTLADMIIKEARTYIGTPYSYGTNSGRTFDCSGFTGKVYEKFGYHLARSSKGQAKDGRAVEGSFSNLQKGDIVVFGARRNGRTVGHVGIFIELTDGGNDFRFIHAAVTGGVRIDQYSAPYYAGRFLGARRIIPDFVSVDEKAKKKDYSFDIENTVVKPDVLKLKKGDRRIVLLEDGKWALVESDGKLKKPDGEEKIVLDPTTGSWSSVKMSKKILPSLSGYDSEPAETSRSVSAAGSSKSSQASSGSSQAGKTAEPKAASTAAASAGQSSPAYHTVKSGDTLSAIATKNHTTVAKLCELNKITTKTVLQIGRKLRVK